ncbi:hypothetical protein GGR51DRAFT_224842 [Nemania sp. FL0031]|nr:hypothetical protein GGR51DRAFT_224842 [Nemania sp. FL0031]
MMPSTCSGEARERRIKRRSRYGCRNCKLRKVKCDESKPQCKRCTSFGVLCNIVLGVPDLQPVNHDAVGSSTTRTRVELRAPLTNAIWTSDASTHYQLNSKCQDFISRYLGRSLTTPEDSNMMQVNRKLLVLAFAHPYLMHASLAVAFAYDRYLNNSLDSSRTVEECYHCSQSTALFNKQLREPIRINEKDSIWGTAAALAVLSFASPDTRDTAENSWPINPWKPIDLEWLRLSKGKMSLWSMVNPLRPDSIFRVMSSTFAEMRSPLPEVGIDGIPSALTIVCGLHDSSTADDNPYFDPAHALSRILGLADSEVTTGQTELFTRSIHGPFQSLLLERDPVALSLLYLWYRKAGRSIWWIDLRARVECPVIYLYLQQYHAGNHGVQELLGGSLVNI